MFPTDLQPPVRLSIRQERILAEGLEQAARILVSAGTTDRLRAEAAISGLYAQAQIEPPRFVWCDSPLQCLHLTQVLSCCHDATRRLVGDPLFDGPFQRPPGWEREIVSAITETPSLLAQIRERGVLHARSIALRVRDDCTYRRKATSELANNPAVVGMIRGGLGDAPTEELLTAFREGGGKDVPPYPGSTPSSCFWGQFDALWIAQYEFLWSTLATPSSDPLVLRLLAETARSCAWWYPLSKVCVVCTRPNLLQVDGGMRLHSGCGPALRFEGGQELYALHGVVVTGDWCTPMDTPEPHVVGRIQSIVNAEIRAVLIEQYGRERFLRDARASLIHQDRWGRLWRIPGAVEYIDLTPQRETHNEYESVTGEDAVFVEVTNATAGPDGTRRIYILQVPPTIPTAHAAVAWTFGMTPNEYHPDAES